MAYRKMIKCLCGRTVAQKADGTPWTHRHAMGYVEKVAVPAPVEEVQESAPEQNPAADVPVHVDVLFGLLQTVMNSLEGCGENPVVTTVHGTAVIQGTDIVLERGPQDKYWLRTERNA